MEVTTIFWIFVSIFSITAIITLLGITNVLKEIKEEYLRNLFYALILEVVIAVIAVFNGVDFSDDSVKLQTIIERSEVNEDFENEEQRADYIITQLNKSMQLPKLENTLQAMEKNNEEIREDLDSCNNNLNELDRSFYSKIFRLRSEISRYSGSINLYYKAEEKRAVFQLLEDIFEILGELNRGSDIDRNELQKEYKEFERRNGLYNRGELLITEFETTLLIREYLNKFYPIKD